MIIYRIRSNKTGKILLQSETVGDAIRECIARGYNVRGKK